MLSISSLCYCLRSWRGFACGTPWSPSGPRPIVQTRAYYGSYVIIWRRRTQIENNRPRPHVRFRPTLREKKWSPGITSLRRTHNLPPRAVPQPTPSGTRLHIQSRSPSYAQPRTEETVPQRPRMSSPTAPHLPSHAADSTTDGSVTPSAGSSRGGEKTLHVCT